MGVFALVGLSNGIVSGLEKFEGADPAYWCAKGYAICNPDIRGVVDSEGDSVLWTARMAAIATTSSSGSPSRSGAAERSR
jgi:hypothetical protein